MRANGSVMGIDWSPAGCPVLVRTWRLRQGSIICYRDSVPSEICSKRHLHQAFAQCWLNYAKLSILGRLLLSEQTSLSCVSRTHETKQWGRVYPLPLLCPLPQRQTHLYRVLSVDLPLAIESELLALTSGLVLFLESPWFSFLSLFPIPLLTFPRERDKVLGRQKYFPVLLTI